MSYYASNRPYNSAYEQKDGNGNGAIIGAGIGAAMAGGAHYGMPKVARRLNSAELDYNKIMGTVGAKSKDKLAALAKMNSPEEKARREKSKKISGYHKSAFGSGWRKAASYGASALLGMGAGAGIDAMMD